MDLKDNIQETRNTYFIEKTGEIDVKSFLQDTLLAQDEERVSQALETMERETKIFPMGNTNPSTLDSFTEFINQKGIETEDESQAIDTTIIRVLKSLKGLYSIDNRDEMLLFTEYVVSSYLIDDNSRFERAVLSNGVIFDQHMRVNSAPRNIQRFVNTKEMGIVLAKVRDIFHQYL